jgi:hypothetical protein
MDYWTDEIPSLGGPRLQTAPAVLQTVTGQSAQFSQGSPTGGPGAEYDFTYIRKGESLRGATGNEGDSSRPLQRRAGGRVMKPSDNGAFGSTITADDIAAAIDGMYGFCPDPGRKISARIFAVAVVEREPGALTCTMMRWPF